MGSPISAMSSSAMRRPRSPNAGIRSRRSRSSGSARTRCMWKRHLAKVVSGDAGKVSRKLGAIQTFSFRHAPSALEFLHRSPCEVLVSDVHMER